MTRRPARAVGSVQTLARVAVVVLFAALAAVGLALPASAHNVLLSSNPADGAVLQAAPTTVQLTFDQPVQDFEPVVTVLGPDGQRYESGTPQVDSTEVTAGVNALPGPGDYVIAYRVVSADGHPVQGEIRFTMAAGASGATGSAGGTSGSGARSSGAGASAEATASVAPVPATGSAAPATAASSTSSGLSGWVWAAIALAAVLVVAAVVVIVRRPRSEP